MARNRRLVFTALGIGLAWWGLHAIERAAAGGGHTPVGQSADGARVLYLTQSAGFAHPVLALSEEILPVIGREQGGFEVDIVRDAALIHHTSLARYDAVVFYTTGELPMSDRQKRSLLDFVAAGHGFVGIHSATDTFYEWPAYGELVGGYFDNHPWRQEVGIRVEDASHPATRHLGAGFRIRDEIYQFRRWDRSRVHVLLSLDTTTVDPDAEGVHRTDGDFGLAWTRAHGRGRMFYTALGHEPEVWRDSRFQRHLVEGIRWAMGQAPAMTDAAPNTLTAAEEADGWRLLFDGQSLDPWRGYKRETLADGWQAVDGTLARVGPGGDIVTRERYASFELRFDWKVETGSNSGLFFGVSEDDDAVWHSGPEFQLLDNAGHRDGRQPVTSAGSNFAVDPPVRDVTHPVGEWNESRLTVDGSRVTHWMNGVELLAYTLDSPAWRAAVAASKFAELPRYGRVSPGHIAIQDHGDPVWFRNLKIRRLP